MRNLIATLVILEILLSFHTAAAENQQFIYVTDNFNYRVQKFDMKGQYVSQFGSEGTGNGQFSSIRSMTTDTLGNIWVVDGHRVEEFDLHGNYLSEIALSTYGPLVKDHDDNFWMVGNGLEKHNANGQLLSRSGQSFYPLHMTSPRLEITAADGNFCYPQGIAIDKTGNIYVADSGNNRIQKFDSHGNYLSQMGKDSHLWYPTDIVTDQSGNIWVSEDHSSRIVEFDGEGHLLRQIGSHGTDIGQFIHPGGIASDSDGTIWAVDAGDGSLGKGFARIQQFDSTGHYLKEFGTYGTGNGQFRGPDSIVIGK